MSCAKTAELIEIPFGLRIWVSQRNRVLDEVSDPPWKGQLLEGKGAVHCEVQRLSAVDLAQNRPLWRLMSMYGVSFVSVDKPCQSREAMDLSSFISVDQQCHRREAVKLSSFVSVDQQCQRCEAMKLSFSGQTVPES